MANFNPVPKPKDAKKRKKYNGWKGKAERICHYCGTYGAERHEIYGGSNRQNSIDHGFQLDLCPRCHLAWHEQKEKLWISRKAEWQQKCQADYEQKLTETGVKPVQARECWMYLIGKNYLD